MKEEKDRIRADLEKKQKEEKKRRRDEKKRLKKEERRKKRSKREGKEGEGGEAEEEKKEDSKKSWSEEEESVDEAEEERKRARNRLNLVHTEPDDAKKPSVRYVLHVFKSGQIFGGTTPYPILHTLILTRSLTFKPLYLYTKGAAIGLARMKW